MSSLVLENCGEVGDFGNSLCCSAFGVFFVGNDLGIVGIDCPAGDLIISGVANEGVLGTSLAVGESRSMR